MARLAAADPGNAGWQRDLITAKGRIGGLEQARLPAAPATPASRGCKKASRQVPGGSRVPFLAAP
jgi:hypothetical protein